MSTSKAQSLRKSYTVFTQHRELYSGNLILFSGGSGIYNCHCRILIIYQKEKESDFTFYGLHLIPHSITPRERPEDPMKEVLQSLLREPKMLLQSPAELIASVHGIPLTVPYSQLLSVFGFSGFVWFCFVSLFQNYY